MRTAPKQPTTPLTLTTGLAGGSVLGMLGITLTGHLVYNGIPRDRLTGYLAAALIVAVIAIGLGICCVARHIRAALAEERRRGVLAAKRAAWHDEVLPTRHAGRVYAARASQGETIAFARGDTTTQTRPEPTVEEARAQGFAEGYVEGIARRIDAAE